MSKAIKHIRVRNVYKIYNIFSKIIDRLPKTFPKVALVVHTNLEELQKYYMDTTEYDQNEHMPFAFCDGDTYTIHVHLTMDDEKESDIAWYFLHELGHLYAHHKYGYEDKRWEDYKTAEKYADKFANRWVKKLKYERRIRK